MRIEILRRASGEEKARWQRFSYEPASEAETVATALTRLNEREPLRDEEGLEVPPIRWDCSCLQKKCGACAMVVNGRPRLACEALLTDYPKGLRLEPLRKFPVVAELVVDRSVLFENLEKLRLWLEAEPVGTDATVETAYEASRCLQCGCCLEVCPNFAPGGPFAGMAAAVPMTRLLVQLPSSERKELAALYRGHIYEGCGKSLACRDICPAGIDIEAMLVSSNAIAVWKRLNRR